MADETSPWQPVALTPEIPAGVTRAVILEAAEIVLWRGADGEIRAWDDRCPHRGMRLSYGFVRENSLNCLYHGWQYDGSSHCIHIPAHPDLEVPKTIRATAFAVHEAGGLIWINTAGIAALPPPVAAGVPLVSTAVNRPIAALRELLGATSTHPAVVRDDLAAGVSLLLAAHPVDSGKSMLHALTIGGSSRPADRQGYVAAVRELRRQAEARSEAA
jgi:nitrite reductase/ring-hydroxylating ferredoxin subunit